METATDKIAVISDIHSNLEALTAVLADIAQRGVSRILCLGDVVGYGPQPQECVDLVIKHCQLTLMGNHDFAVLYEPYNFNSAAESACFWTRQTLEAEPDQAARDSRWDFLGNLPVKRKLTPEENPVGEVTLVHGSPRRPVNEYLFPDDVYNNPGKLNSSFDRFENLCLIGHTHVPGVFLQTPDFYSPDELGGQYELDQHKAIVNVGSVGQPRDRDPRASYAILEGGLVRFVRVGYEVDAAIERFRAVKELEEYLGNRLREGR
jgi:predicted phosphodiesterase